MGIKSYINLILGDRNVVEPTYDNYTRGTTNNIIATGGTISTPGDGYVYHTFTTPGTFTVTNGVGNIEMVAIGAGGGGGGFDPAVPGGGGGGGGISYATFYFAPSSPALTVSVGGGGGGGATLVTNTGGGTAGTNGGGTGGNAGASGASGAGGGGGGWSGIFNPSIYYAVGGGGAGGGGSNEGPANNIPALGGGSPSNTYSPSSLTGANGSNFGPTDGGGYGGSGGGFNGSTGGGGVGGTTQSGGSNYANPSALSSILYAGGDGSAPANPTAGSRAPGFLPANPSWTPVIPATAGNGGAGDTNPGGSGTAGVNGIVILRYLL